MLQIPGRGTRKLGSVTVQTTSYNIKITFAYPNCCHLPSDNDSKGLKKDDVAKGCVCDGWAALHQSKTKSLCYGEGNGSGSDGPRLYKCTMDYSQFRGNHTDTTRYVMADKLTT